MKEAERPEKRLRGKKTKNISIYIHMGDMCLIYVYIHTHIDVIFRRKERKANTVK